MRFFKRTTTFFCIAAGIYMFSLPVSAASFADVPLTHPMYDAITYLSDRGYVSGYEDGTFKPERVVTRAEIVKLALNTSEITLSTEGELPLSDVAKDTWYYPYILTAYNKGIIGGYEDGTYHPNDTVTRAEGLKIILKTLQIDVSAYSQVQLKDVTPADWFAPYVGYIQHFNLMTLTGDEFKPNQNMTRQDTAELMYHFVQAKEISGFTTWSIIPWIIFCILYALLSLIVFYFTRKDRYKWLYVATAPISIVFIVFRQFRYVKPPKEDIEQIEVISRRKRFAYFKTPRKIEKELWYLIDYNVKPLLAFWSLILMWIIMISIITTQVDTLKYKKSFETLAKTYVVMDSN